MKFTNFLIAAATSISSIAFSEEIPKTSPLQEPINYHRVYGGLDLFVSHFSMTTGSPWSGINKIAENELYSGLKMGYDFLKPRALYVGTEGLISGGKAINSCNGRTHGGQTALLANIEQRFGYTFSSLISNKSTITPFAGLGWYHNLFHMDDWTTASTWFYSTLGVRMNQEFRKDFDVGMNLKFLYTIAGRKKENRPWFGNHSMQNTIGYEIAMPLSWHVGNSQRWDFQLQPYLLKLDASSLSTIVGSRVLAGYSF